jgi:hypothetical protein
MPGASPDGVTGIVSACEALAGPRTPPRHDPVRSLTSVRERKAARVSVAKSGWAGEQGIRCPHGKLRGIREVLEALHLRGGATRKSCGATDRRALPKSRAHTRRYTTSETSRARDESEGRSERSRPSPLGEAPGDGKSSLALASRLRTIRLPAINTRALEDYCRHESATRRRATLELVGPVCGEIYGNVASDPPM